MKSALKKGIMYVYKNGTFLRLFQYNPEGNQCTYFVSTIISFCLICYSSKRSTCIRARIAFVLIVPKRRVIMKGCLRNTVVKEGHLTFQNPLPVN